MAKSVATVMIVLLLTSCVWSVHAEVIELEGTVKAVDADARTVTIERKTASGTKLLTLEVAKKAGNVADLKPGSLISFSYDPDLEIVTKLATNANQNGTSRGSSSRGKRAPGQREWRICREVVQKLENEHYLQPRIDNDICSQMMESFLRSLDPLKSYLRQEDISEFEKKKQALAGQVNGGDLSVFYDVFNHFVDRVTVQLPAIEKLIDSPHDFTAREFIETGKEGMTWATDDSDSLDKWRRRIKYDLLVLKTQGVTGREAKEKLRHRYRSFSARMERMTDEELLESILNSLTTSVDPYSTYMAGETVRNFEIGRKMHLDGIGAQLKSEDGYVTVVELTPGGAAEKDGRLRPSDRIVGIGQGQEGEIEDIVSKSLNETVGLIRGERGTTVRLQVLPSGGGAAKVYDITRSRIDIGAELRAEVMNVDRPGGKAIRVGMIVIPVFYADLGAMQRGDKNYKSVVKDCKAVLEGFRLQNVDCVVVDVRNNGGGNLIPQMVGLFVGRGRVAQFKTRDGEVKPLDHNDPDVAWSGPLVVLTNRMSSSGAEMFVAAIQDHHRGLIIGDTTTYGRASFQTTVELEDKERSGMMRITSMCFFRATGEAYQQRGVRSDVVLPSRTDGLPIGEHTRRHALAVERVPKAGFQPAFGEKRTLVGQMQRQSETRVNASPEFQQVIRDNEAYERRRNAGKVSLVEAEFVADFAKSLDSDPTRGESPKSGVGRIARDFYLEEVLAIAADLTKASNGK